MHLYFFDISKKKYICIEQLHTPIIHIYLNSNQNQVTYRTPNI